MPAKKIKISLGTLGPYDVLDGPVDELSERISRAIAIMQERFVNARPGQLPLKDLEIVFDQGYYDEDPSAMKVYGYRDETPEEAKARRLKAEKAAAKKKLEMDAARKQEYIRYLVQKQKFEVLTGEEARLLGIEV